MGQSVKLQDRQITDYERGDTVSASDLESVTVVETDTSQIEAERYREMLKVTEN